MAPPKKKAEEITPSVLPAVMPRKELILQGNPEEQIKFAQQAATALMKVAKPVEIQGKPYLQFGGWQTLARFFGATVGIEWTQKLVDDKGNLVGYEARAQVLQQGVVISSAESSCMMTEKRWKTAEEFAIKSMAQTRASAKALRNAFGWVAELAEDPSTGQKLQSTPAEEMQYDRSPVSSRAKVHAYVPEEHASEPVSGEEYVCEDSGATISQAEYDYSMKFYGKPLSRAAQKNHPRIK